MTTPSTSCISPSPATLRIVQNCFLPEQLESCAFEPYLNERPRQPDEKYLFFESNVIRSLVQDGWHLGHDYFGVLGHRWEAKLDEARKWGMPLRNVSRGTVTGEAVVRFVHRNPQADFVSLGRFLPHPVFRVADKIHPGLMEATGRLLAHIGIRCDLRRTIDQPIYFNSFIGKRDAVEAYVREMLAPVIHAATHDPDLRRLCFRDAGYRHAFPAALSDLYSIPYFPLHSFIGERLINVHVLLSGARVASFEGSTRPGLVPRVCSAVRSVSQSMECRWELWRRWTG